jgi:hypothetical protein
VKAALIGQILIRKGKIWIARLRIDHVAIFRASARRIFNAAALIGLVAVVDLAVIASVEEDSVAAVIALAAVDLADLADSAAAVAAGSEAGDEN